MSNKIEIVSESIVSLWRSYSLSNLHYACDISIYNLNLLFF